jgi:DNA-binding LacI/PurR family transcriptional regulator
MNSIPIKSSLPELVLNRLRTGIESGEWQERLPSERDLSRTLQVSRPTLRLALDQLKQEEWIKVDGRCTVINTGKRKGTSPSDSMRTRSIVFLSPVPLEELPSMALLLYSELGQRLAPLGATIQISVSPGMTRQKVDRYLDSVSNRLNVDAWVLFRSTKEVQRYFQERSMPAVIFGNAHQGIEIPALEVDYAAALRHCVTNLKRLRHDLRRVFLFLPESDLAGHHEVGAEFLRLTGKEGQQRILRHHEEGDNIEVLLGKALRAKPVISAAIVLRTSAAATMHGLAMHRFGKRIPKELSIVCMEDASFMHSLVPPISRYHVDNNRAVQMVFHSLSRQLSSGIRRAWKHQPIVPEFIVGGTLAPGYGNTE